MNPKERYYSGVARETIHRITANRENWTSFLATMARNYDFTYPEQVMIYAQRPNATLCKPYEEWNTDQYRRYVKRGSTGIALFVMNQDKPYLRYVFDVADTGVRRSSPSITPWRVTDENRRFIMDEMERVFQVPSEGILEYQLENIAINLAREYWDDFKKPILDIVADSFLEEYDEYNIEVAFKTAWKRNTAGQTDNNFEGGQSSLWSGSGNCDYIVLNQGISVSGIAVSISWPPSVSGSGSSASWQSQPVYDNVAGASFNGLVVGGTAFSCTFSENGDVYVGSRIYRPTTTIKFSYFS